MDLIKIRGSAPSSISSKVDGKTKINITTTTAMKMERPSSLYYYSGFIQVGCKIEKGYHVKTTIFGFSSLETARDLYTKLAEIDHPSVLDGLGHGSGIGSHSKYSFLAVQSFDATFETYTHKNGPATDEVGRFTEEFIKLVSDVILGMEELHLYDYHCPMLKGDDIAIVKEENSLSAKLWNFSKCSSERKKEKNEDWYKLGLMLLGPSSLNHEGKDLYNRITSGELKGMDILKHSALFTVRKKFENILSLNLHIALNHPKGKVQASSQNDQKKYLEAADLCLTNLEEDLDKELHWKLPQWINARMHRQGSNTLREFINKIRIIIEHEVEFLSPEMTRELSFKDREHGTKHKDLEHHLQQSCGSLLLKLQMFATELGLKY